jgi:hypothetical protein
MTAQKPKAQAAGAGKQQAYGDGLPLRLVHCVLNLVAAESLPQGYRGHLARKQWCGQCRRPGCSICFDFCFF